MSKGMFDTFAPERVTDAPLTRVYRALEPLDEHEFGSPGYMAIAQGALDIANAAVDEVVPGTPQADTLIYVILSLSQFVAVDWTGTMPADLRASAAQARAPKGSPGGTGGEWIDTPSAIAAQVQGESMEPAPANQIGGGRRVKYAAPLADNSPRSALQANPSGNMINCQKCTTVYEMRRRGMDVVAGPGMGENLGGKKGLGDYFAAEPPVRLADEVPFADNPTAMLRASGAYLSQFGPDSRGAVQVAFPATGGGHVFNWEVDNVGDVHFMDAQIGRELTGKDLTDTFAGVDAYSIKFQRLDNVRIGNPAQDAVDQRLTPLYDQPQTQVEAA